MRVNGITDLATLCEERRSSLLSGWTQSVRKRRGRTPELSQQFPQILNAICARLRDSGREPICFEQEFDVLAAVEELGILRECIHGLATASHLHVTPDLNRVVDNLIARAVQAQHVKACHKHLALLAHEFRTPLTAAVMAAHLLDAGIPKESKGADYPLLLETLRSNLGRLKDLIAEAVE